MLKRCTCRCIGGHSYNAAEQDIACETRSTAARNPCLD
jgi:hypothetical protein